MADELAKQLAEQIAAAKRAMFGTQQPSPGKILLMVKGDVKVESSDPRVEVRRG